MDKRTNSIYSPFPGVMANSGPSPRLSTVEVEEVEKDGREERVKRQKLPESWKTKFAFKAKYRMLIVALLKIGRTDQAQQVCHVLLSQHSKEGT